ncbi:MAG: hypothetical protein QNJ88_09485 [Acidimicrobiia bacterium]|nr:hypothetical protein [Acidimicrobiia bacterium]
MRRLLIVVLVLAALVAACGDGEGIPTTRAPELSPVLTTEPALPTSPPPVDAVTVGQQMLDAFLVGDATTWRGLLSSDSPMLAEPGWVPDDFDGDGLKTVADVVQHRAALGPAANRRGSGTCEVIAGTEEGTRVHCSYSLTDRFYEAAGYAEVSEITAYTVLDGKVTDIETVEGNSDAFAERMEELFEYEQWVQETQSDRYDSVFHNPCCEGNFVRLPDTIPIHEELMSEYFDTID